LTAQQ
jgi:NIMA (never in mitosis gene a)-related kinase